MNIIESNSDFLDKIKDLRREKIIGIDTEFIRINTYFAKLCLVQVSTPNSYFAIDPLKVDMSPFKEILESDDIIKVFHASHQDLGIFYHDLKAVTKNIFDTQEAAKLAGIKRQISYRELCYKILNIDFIKNQGFRDWAVRPLPEGMLEYALKDVKYLIQLYHELKLRLKGNSANVAFKESMKNLEDKKNYTENAENSWKKIKFYDKSPEFLDRIKILSEFREEIAMKQDIPRKHVMSDEDLILITKKLPKNSQELASLKIKSKIENKYTDRLFDICSGF